MAAEDGPQDALPAVCHIDRLDDDLLTRLLQLLIPDTWHLQYKPLKAIALVSRCGCLSFCLVLMCCIEITREPLPLVICISRLAFHALELKDHLPRVALRHVNFQAVALCCSGHQVPTPCDLEPPCKAHQLLPAGHAWLGGALLVVLSQTGPGHDFGSMPWQRLSGASAPPSRSRAPDKAVP